MHPARKFLFLLAASLGVLLLLHSSLVGLVGSPSPAQATEGTLTVQSDIASFSGTLTQGGNQPIRTAFGPLRLDYKSGPNAWTTGLLMREGDGNITIGAGITSADFNSTSKLRVLGVVESTTGGFKFPDATTQTTAASGGVPAGGVMFFNLSSCPSGWTELTAARGMTMVGLPSAGTLAGTVGTGFTNLEDRTHTHTVDPASTATDSQGAHTHTGPSHTHTVDVWATNYTGTILTAQASGSNYTTITTELAGTSWQNHNSIGWDSPFRGKRETTAAGGTGATSSNGAHTHSVDIASTTSSATSVTMPYIQLLACQKS